MKLGQFLKEADLTQEAFALKVGVKTAAVTRWSNGTRRSRDPILLNKIKELTGGKVTADDFFSFEEPKILT